MEGSQHTTASSCARGEDYPYPDPLNEKQLRVWVGNIPSNICLKEFIAVIQESSIPPVTGVVLRNGPVRSWGFLTFQTPEEAAEGIQIIQGTCLFPGSDVPLEARLANPHESKDALSVSSASNNCGEDNMSKNSALLNQACRNSFLDALSQDDYDILQDADSSTLWHVYKDENDVPYYYNQITGCTQWERPIPPLLAVEMAINGRNNVIPGSGLSLVVHYLPRSWDDTEFAMHFTTFGNLMSARVHKDAQGQNTGFGFLSYDNPQSAAAAMRLMNGYATNSRFLKIEFNKYDIPPQSP